ncbi:MAG: GTPase [Ruminococcus callidus]
MEQNRNQTPRANRVHIGFFGRRNAGKSSLINAVAGQTISVVSLSAAPPQTPWKKQWNCCRSEQLC